MTIVNGISWSISQGNYMFCTQTQSGTGTYDIRSGCLVNCDTQKEDHMTID